MQEDPTNLHLLTGCFAGLGRVVITIMMAVKSTIVITCFDGHDYDNDYDVDCGQDYYDAYDDRHH